MEFRLLIYLSLLVWLAGGCTQEEETQKAPLKKENCDLYIRHIKKLENLLIETDRNADRLENVLYTLTGNNLLIDEKIRLVQKIRHQPGQEKLLQRTASEIILIFRYSRSLLDSAEREIKMSKIPQSSLLPIIDNVRNYISRQENLFIEVNGSIQNISRQVAELRKEVEQQKKRQAKPGKRRASDTRWLNETEEEAYQKKNIYYMVGTRDELTRTRVVEKKGGVLGIGSTLRLSDKLEDRYFQTADFMIMKEIALGNTGKVIIITTHPKNSYLIVNTPGEKFLKITNPEKFWSASNYLVVEVD